MLSAFKIHITMKLPVVNKPSEKLDLWDIWLYKFSGWLSIGFFGADNGFV